MNRTRLNAVLRIRQIQERAARGEVAMNRNVHRVAAAAEARTWQMLDDRAATAAVASVERLLAERALVSAGMLAAEIQEIATVEAAEQVDAALSIWTLAARRVEGLERLAERNAEIEREDADRRIANEIDDLVLVGFAGRAS